MSLRAFTADNIVRIVDDCEAFARTMLPAAEGMDKEALRDHAAQILEAICRDLGRAQSASQQLQKSLGHGPTLSGESAAETHGALRAASGFNVSQTAAEYRALRASVIRLWLETGPTLGPAEVTELTRFNEALDQAVAESLAYFSAAAARDRNLFLGVLSHELRTPLATIYASVHIIDRATDSKHRGEAAARIERGARRIESVLNDLLEFVRSRNGGMRVTPSTVRVDELCARIGREIEVAHHGAFITINCKGDMVAVWDEQRIAQAISNLATNAIKYGAQGAPVTLMVDGTDEHDLVLEVTNVGREIPDAMRESLFEPLVRSTGPDSTGVSLGLGLYIVRQIARAHGGDVAVDTPSPGTTTFTMKLKRFCNPMQTHAFGQLGID